MSPRLKAIGVLALVFILIGLWVFLLTVTPPETVNSVAFVSSILLLAGCLVAYITYIICVYYVELKKYFERREGGKKRMENPGPYYTED